MSLLVEDWVSAASALQRRGRAGRVRAGHCFGLYTRQRFEERLRKYQVWGGPFAPAVLGPRWAEPMCPSLQGPVHRARPALWHIGVLQQTHRDGHDAHATCGMFLWLAGMQQPSAEVAWLCRPMRRISRLPFADALCCSSCAFGCPAQAPEMVRVPLEELVLQIHALGLGPAAQFLDRVLEPPPARSVAGALAQLRAIGALTPDERLTPLGEPRKLPYVLPPFHSCPALCFLGHGARVFCRSRRGACKGRAWARACT